MSVGEMKRIPIIFLASILSVSQANAQEWQLFDMKRFGFVFDVPPDFQLTDSYGFDVPPDTDQYGDDGTDGAVFLASDGAILTVWGISLEDRDFLTQVREQIRQTEEHGWKITYKRLTPNWVSYSGIKDDQIRYVRATAVCDDRAAFFLVDYGRDKKVLYDPVVVRMVRSLRSEEC